MAAHGAPAGSFFLQLKSHCVDLLRLLHSPRKSSPALTELADLLRRAPPDALQPCLEFTMLPLMLLYDAAVLCRSERTGGSPKEQLCSVSGYKQKVHQISDSVAEAVLLCLEEILKKCHLETVNQMVMVLKKLAVGAMLSPAEASEEFREGVVRCLKSVILRLESCTNKKCLCNNVTTFPAFLLDEHLKNLLPSPCCRPSKSEECLLAFLQSRDASPAVGHWLSLLLQIADTEADRGLHGSSKLRTEAFMTLRVLVAKVGSADALAFFLPGVMSQLIKVLHVSKSMISGAAGSVESLDNAIRCLAEFLIIVLADDANVIIADNFSSIESQSKANYSTSYVLETMRNFSETSESKRRLLQHASSNSDVGLEEKRLNSAYSEKLLHVERTKKWLDETSNHVEKLLSSTFPHICVHSARKVRKGLVDAIQGIVLKCTDTLKGSKLMLLECLCVLSCDDSVDVSSDAQNVLECLFMNKGKYISESELSDLFGSLIEKLPRLVLGTRETVVLSHAQKLLVVIYYAGPQLLRRHLLSSPVEAAQFLNVLVLALGHNSVFAGSVNTLVRATQNPVTYLASISELKAEMSLGCNDVISASVKFPLPYAHYCSNNYYDVPHIPPWLVQVGSQKVYEVLAGILRLVGLATMPDFGCGIPLSILVDLQLESIRKLVLDLRMREYSKESWNSWYERNGSGQLLRQASTSICVLNEIIFGLSNESPDRFANILKKCWKSAKSYDEHVDECTNNSMWKITRERVLRNDVVDCVGSIIHEYLSSEVWKIPTDQKSLLLTQDEERRNTSLYFFQDTTNLHQVIIDGIGVFSVTLGEEFVSAGFLHTTLYFLLENLICSSNHLRSAADGVLHVLASSSGHPMVGHLIVANSDYIIDSLCRQLRHLDLSPHMPDVLTAVLSYVGVAHKILPLLEEPMRSISAELEILGRYQHPQLTLPFLKAMAEICKASRNEATVVLDEVISYSNYVKSMTSELKTRVRQTRQNISAAGCSEICTSREDFGIEAEKWDEMLLKLSEFRRHRRIVASITESCLLTATPIIASLEEATCIVALGIIEDGVFALAKVEEAYRHELESKDAITHSIQSCHDLEVNADTTDGDADENRLLPAVNKIWPHMVQCVKGKNFLAIRRCLAVVSRTISVCGGNFFVRRFHIDGSHFWKFLSTSAFRRNFRSRDEIKLVLPYRNTTDCSEESMAEVSSIKVQLAALNMIAEISRDKKSCSALEAVLKKVSGLVVSIACSGISGLLEAAINALLALACIDPDLIWILVADVYYSSKKKVLLPPCSEFREVSQILPPPLSSKDYLYVQYGGQSLVFDINEPSVEAVFQRLQSADIFS